MINETILPRIKAGATVRVWETIKDGEKTRTSRFEGVVIARKHGTEPGASFTVRTTVASEGIEKLYPIYCPSISKVEIISSPNKVGKSKIYYIRNISRKELRRKTRVSKEKTTKVAREIKDSKEAAPEVEATVEVKSDE